MTGDNIEGRAVYPGPEQFWRQSPELIKMQGELGKLWDTLEKIPSFPQREVLSKKPGEIIAIKERTDLYTGYTIFELRSKPTVGEQYYSKPYCLQPRVSKKGEDPQIMVSLEKWPSGYRINGEPVTEGPDWSSIIHRGKAEFKDIPQVVRSEGVRLVALKLMEEDKRLTEAARQKDKRILDLVKSAIERPR